MEPHIRARFAPEVHDAVAAAVGVAPDALVSLGGFESFVFEIPGQPTIVKATWSGRRTVAQVGAELHFVNYLADNGAPVCRALPLADGAMVRSVPAEGGAFQVSAFARAPGGRLPRAQWTPQTFMQWGEVVGQLHRLSTDYPGPPPPMSRPDWLEEHHSLGALIAEPDIRARYNQTLDRIGDLPRDPGSFGTMHTDLHANNLHWHEGEVHLFDFEDMIDFWFISDLAIVLYYALLHPIWNPGDRQADFEAAHTALMAGYRRQHTLPEQSLRALPLFMGLREQTLRAVSIRSIPAEKRSEAGVRFLREVTHRIRTGSPALGLKFS